jgi:hypothetical protein
MEVQELIRALFNIALVSPRYVMVREARIPEESG